MSWPGPGNTTVDFKASAVISSADLNFLVKLMFFVGHLTFAVGTWNGHVRHLLKGE